MKRNLKNIITNIQYIKKRYYILFTLLIVFSVYNTITLRGFFYAENDLFAMFGFMDKWHGYTNVVGRSVGETDATLGYVPDPKNIHDTGYAHEWYGSICGTIVFMKWKWIGLHLGDHMILIDTRIVDDCYTGENHFFGHPYYILTRFDKVDNYPTEDERGDKLLRKWEKRFGLKEDKKGLENADKFRKNVRKYRIYTGIFYTALVIGIIVMILLTVRRRKRKRVSGTTS